MPSHISHVISQIPPSLASTCPVASYTSYQKWHPLWQVHAKSHLTRHIKIPPSLASRCQVTSYTSYQKSHPLCQVHASVTSYTSYQYPMQMREKVGKSRNTMFFQWFVAQEGGKVGSLTLGVRTTFGGWDVEKVHAVVARSAFRSQNVQNTRGSDHFWRLRCRKSARPCGAKHISKWKCSKHWGFRPLLEVQMSLRFTTRHYSPLHYTTGHYTTLHYTPVHYITLHYTPVHSTTLNYTTPRYITLHYAPLHSTTLHHITLHYTPLHYITLYYIIFHYTSLPYTTLHYTPLHYSYNYNCATRLHYTPLH